MYTFISDEIMEIFTNIEGNLYECNKCGKVIKRNPRMGLYHLRKHIEYIHFANQHIECNQCGKEFKNMYAIKKHKYIAHKK